MNNGTANLTSSSAVSADLIQDINLSYVNTFVDVSLLTLLFYTTVLAMSEEMEYMWLSPKPLSIPNLLYASTRYGGLINQALSLLLDFGLPGSSACNDLANIQNAMATLPFVGVQGLLVVRTYSLCQGNKIITGTLAFFFVAPLIIRIYSDVVLPGCTEIINHNIIPELLSINICTSLTDLLAFCVCLWRVWGTWKLKRDIGIQGYNDLVSVLLRQTVSRFCFAIIFTIAIATLDEIAPTTPLALLSNFQHGFSTILLADFALDLRQQNSAAIQSANITLPTIEFQSVMHYIHESILVEMGDHENATTREGGDDDPSGSPGVEIRHESA